jgi:hypothetical protein
MRAQCENPNDAKRQSQLDTSKNLPKSARF